MNVQFQINAGTSSKRRGVGVILTLTAYIRHPIIRGPAFNRENTVLLLQLTSEFFQVVNASVATTNSLHENSSRKKKNVVCVWRGAVRGVGAMGREPDTNSRVGRERTGSRKIEGREQNPQDDGKREK